MPRRAVASKAEKPSFVVIDDSSDDDSPLSPRDTTKMPKTALTPSTTDNEPSSSTTGLIKVRKEHSLLEDIDALDLFTNKSSTASSLP